LRSNLKKYALVLAFITLLALPLVRFPSQCSAQSTYQDTTLDFLATIVGVDVAKYEIEARVMPDVGLGVADLSIKYSFESDGSKMEVISDFRNGDLIWCKIYRLEGSPILNVSSVDALDSAKSLMSRYQSVSKAPYLQPISESLNTLTELNSITAEIGNVKLKVYNDGNLSQFSWKDTINGIEIPQKTIGLVFYNGIFEMFSNHWNVYTVGNADVKVDREEAIQVAKERAQSYSYTIGDTVVSNFTILEDLIIAELTMQDRGNCVVYPWWEIRLPLDKVYLGSVTEIRVNMWADTGEVTYVQAIGGGGILDSSNALPNAANPTPTPTSPSSSPKSENENNSTSDMLLISGIAATMIIIGVTATVIKKKRNGK